MEIKYGLVSTDSHGQVPRETWTGRMSAKRWGDLIPHVEEVNDPEVIAKAYMPPPFEGPVERWIVGGKVMEARGVANGPVLTDDAQRRYFYQRWEDVPAKLYDPTARLEALDEDGVDGEVLFPNTPTQSAWFNVATDDPGAFELECVKAHNDEFALWRQVSDRYIPLALIPYRAPIDVVVAEVQRSVDLGHRGINIVAEPSLLDHRLHHFNDRYWDPLWATCQDLEISVNWHGNGGLNLNMAAWSGFSRHRGQAGGGGGTQLAQFLPNLLFSGVLERFPRLQFVCAEAGTAWIYYVLEASDHEWRRRRLWTEGLPTPPSEVFRRNVHVSFWYEEAGIELRHKIGVRNIMFLTDYPHMTSTYPTSHDFVERALKGVPDDERKLLSYENALNLYKV